MKSLEKVPHYYTLLLRKNNPKKLRPGFFYSYQDKANFLRKSAFCASMNQCHVCSLTQLRIVRFCHKFFSLREEFGLIQVKSQKETN